MKNLLARSRRWFRRIRRKGSRSVVVPINDLYDEFNFGERSPFAIRQFLQARDTELEEAADLPAA